MTISQMNNTLTLLNTTGKMVVRDGKEVLEGRPLSLKDSAIRRSITDLMIENSKKTNEEINQLKKEYNELVEQDKDKSQLVFDKIVSLHKQDIECVLTEEHTALIKSCAKDYAGFTPDMDDIASLYV